MQAEEISYSTIDDKLYRSLYRQHSYYVNGIKINVGMYMGVYALCRRNADFRREKLSSPGTDQSRELAIRKSLIRANVNLDGGTRCAAGRDCNPRGRSGGKDRKESNFGSPSPPRCHAALVSSPEDRFARKF